jgi:uncharacterized repeat protein (TIGR03803 family)
MQFMKRALSPLSVIAGSIIGLALAGTASAATITTLASFSYVDSYPVDPSNLAVDAAGNVYGANYQGGPNGDNFGGDGTVYKIAATNHQFRNIGLFNSTNGALPTGVTVDPAGDVYGMTNGGGSLGYGVVFKIAAGANTITDPASFTLQQKGGSTSTALSIDKAGNLYGTIDSNANSDGSIFEVAAGTTTINTLASFTSPEVSSDVIADASGNLFGVTESGGANNDGFIFELAAGSHTISTLASFSVNSGKVVHGGLLAGANGILFGTTVSGGANNDGTIFSFDPSNGTITTLASFNGANGASPEGSLIADAAGNLYGTASSGGANDAGAVFELAAGSGTITALASFSGLANVNGGGPSYGVVADSSGNLFGTTSGGTGTVFELTGSGFVVPEPSSLGLLAAVAAMAVVRPRGRRRSR